MDKNFPWSVKYDPRSDNPFIISRSKIDLYLKCKRCAYLDMRLGIKQPKSFPYNLNSRIDNLLKEEFDLARKKQTKTIYQKEAKIECIPYDHPNLHIWREPFKAARFHHKDTNITVAGSVDDLWQNLDTQKIHIVDYKSTFSEKFSTLKNFNAPYLISYKRQAEIYQWILANLGLNIDDTSYFLYVNADPNQKTFLNKLDFEWAIIPYKSQNYDWINNTIIEIKNFLETNKIPSSSKDCEICKFMSKFFNFIKKPNLI